jgi:hypothetical protein
MIFQACERFLKLRQPISPTGVNGAALKIEEAFWPSIWVFPSYVMTVTRMFGLSWDNATVLTRFALMLCHATATLLIFLVS